MAPKSKSNNEGRRVDMLKTKKMILVNYEFSKETEKQVEDFEDIFWNN